MAIRNTPAKKTKQAKPRRLVEEQILKMPCPVATYLSLSALLSAQKRVVTNVLLLACGGLRFVGGKGNEWPRKSIE